MAVAAEAVLGAECAMDGRVDVELLVVVHMEQGVVILVWEVALEELVHVPLQRSRIAGGLGWRGSHSGGSRIGVEELLARRDWGRRSGCGGGDHAVGLGRRVARRASSLSRSSSSAPWPWPASEGFRVVWWREDLDGGSNRSGPSQPTR